MKIISHVALSAGVLAALLAANVRAESVAGAPLPGKPDAQDPFGGDDPFAVLGAKDRATPDQATQNDPHRGARVKTEGSLFLKSVYNNLNLDSRINPGNRVMLLDQQRQIFEARLTLSQHLDEAQQWRWLFKGFASIASYIDQYGMTNQGGRVDELFVDRKGAGWFANLGKRRIVWGHAQGFNPVNVVVPPRDPTNPSRETEGQPMLWVNKASGAGALDVIATRNYDRNYASDQNRWGVKLSHAAAKSDYALYYFDGSRYRDGRAYERMLGGSFSADVYPGITVYLEAARFADNYRNYYDATGASFFKNGAYSQTVAGSTLNLGGKRSVAVEYFRNEPGYSEAERLNYFQAADQQLSGGPATGIANDFRLTWMNRDYLLVRYQNEWRERYTLDASALLAGDNSHLLRAQGNYAISDYYELRIVLLRYQGSHDSEFGNNPVRNALELWLGANF
ncbi:MAG: hypothetical protein HY016_06710 [Nitrosomonadales bacterium]|nr:hypothetical protein [Nitrosomonadales bacterium]